jgi:hypothetical protein
MHFRVQNTHSHIQAHTEMHEILPDRKFTCFSELLVNLIKRVGEVIKGGE